MGSLSICLHHSQHVSITWQPRGTRVQHRMSLPVPSQSTLHHSQFLMVKNKNKYLLAKKTLGIYKYHCSIYKLFTWCHWKVVFHHSSLFPKHGSGHFFVKPRFNVLGYVYGWLGMIIEMSKIKQNLVIQSCCLSHIISYSSYSRLGHTTLILYMNIYGNNRREYGLWLVDGQQICIDVYFSPATGL